MTSTEAEKVRALVQAISASGHTYLAIRPKASIPNEAPGIEIKDRSAFGLQYAFQTAEQQWPDAQGWEIIASDERFKAAPPDLPPGSIQLRNPIIIAATE